MSSLIPSRSTAGAIRGALAASGLLLALLLALAASALHAQGFDGPSAAAAALALIAAGIVALKLIPRLVRGILRERRMTGYEVTREGGAYLLITILLAVAAVNTGNNLLFLILAVLLAGMLVSGIVSKMVIGGLRIDWTAPEHIFAGEAAPAALEIRNLKRLMPSYSLTIAARPRKKGAGNDHKDGSLLAASAYAPFVPARGGVREDVELQFPRRGLYQADCFDVSSRFPFSILRRKRSFPAGREILVLPPVRDLADSEPRQPPARGEMEAPRKGYGAGLYSLRNYQPGDPARHVDWKATAKARTLIVREFAREEEPRLVIWFDALVGELNESARARFESDINLCARMVWAASQEQCLMQFTGGSLKTPLVSAAEIVYTVLEELAVLEPVAAGATERPVPDLEDLAGWAAAPAEDGVVIFSQRRGPS